MTSDIARIVAGRQRERLTRALERRRQSSATTARPSRSDWAHVPLAELFGACNTIHQHAGGLLESGHEPAHTSKSGRCVLINPATGRWWCRSCRRHGDAVTFVMGVNGWSYPQAAAWLEERYGPPSGRDGATSNRRIRTNAPQRCHVRWRAL